MTTSLQIQSNLIEEKDSVIDRLQREVTQLTEKIRAFRFSGMESVQANQQVWQTPSAREEFQVSLEDFI